MNPLPLPPVQHLPDRSRFQIELDGLHSVCDYRLVDDAMWLTHTEVPPALQGRGIAAALVRAALDHARTAGLRVRPLCSYVRSYMRRHPETQDLLAGEP